MCIECFFSFDSPSIHLEPIHQEENKKSKLTIVVTLIDILVIADPEVQQCYSQTSSRRGFLEDLRRISCFEKLKCQNGGIRRQFISSTSNTMNCGTTPVIAL